MTTLTGKVAWVTGGSRNVGKGIALGLGEGGATVYVTGRSVPDTLATRITECGGRGIAVRCDHANDDEVLAVFERIKRDEGRIDLLVNNAWGGYRRLRNRKEHPGYKWKDPFWRQPPGLWDDMFDVGVRSNFIASAMVARRMIEQRSGLIVHISFFAGRKYYDNVVYGVAKAAVDRLAQDMAVELKPYGVSSIALYPGHVLEEKRSRNPKRESARFVGRAVAALAADPEILRRSGNILVAANLAREYGFTDTDGTQPEPYDSL